MLTLVGINWVFVGGNSINVNCAGANVGGH